MKYPLDFAVSSSVEAWDVGWAGRRRIQEYLDPLLPLHRTAQRLPQGLAHSPHGKAAP